MQCFRYLNFGHKAEFSHIQDCFVKCAGIKILDLAQMMLHSQLGMQTAAGNSPPTLRGAQGHKYTRK